LRGMAQASCGAGALEWKALVLDLMGVTRAA
jgi:hypothetical protein